MSLCLVQMNFVAVHSVAVTLSLLETHVTHGHDDDGHSAAPPDTDADPAMA